MRKMLRLVSMVLVMVMVLGISPVLANDDKVEITFCVGDETLMINGEAVTVERPYVVGDGVTLVPLRVITEAFGATVEWEGTTRSITLTYPDVSILLQIDNPVAEVNSKAETLSAAPQLTNSVTMVPLRFISETFGADVSYEEETKKITVVKEKSENGSLLKGAIDSAKIGDSYYNWSMENPVDMQMDERVFDGTFTAFSSDYGYFTIMITALPEEYDFEKDFVSIKASLQGLTLVKADKNSNNADKKLMHFQAKDRESFLNVRQIVTKEYIYLVYGVFNIEEAEKKEKAVTIMDTFDTTFEGDDIYDLSNVENGMRRFESETLNISFNIPENYFQTSSEDEINNFEFVPLSYDDEVSKIAFGVYSKSHAGGAKALAEKDYLHNKGLLNETIAIFSDGIISKDYADFTAYEYTHTVKYNGNEEYSKDVFFEKGEYTYNIVVRVKLPNVNADEYIDSILNSVVFDTIDADKVGVLMRNIPEATGTFKSKTEDASIELPNIYQAEEGNPSVYLNMVSGIMLTVAKTPADRGVNMTDVVVAMKEIEKEEAKNSDNEIIKNTQESKIGNYSFAEFAVKNQSDDETAYFHQYATCENGAIYVITVGFPEISYSEGNRQEILDIIKTLKIN